MASMQRPTPTSLMLRRMTASAVLDALRAGGPMTGSDLIDATGLARPTVHVVCNDLIRLGWIRETESHRPGGDSRRGRPPRCYEFQSRAGFVLGIDASGPISPDSVFRLCLEGRYDVRVIGDPPKRWRGANRLCEYVAWTRPRRRSCGGSC